MIVIPHCRPDRLLSRLLAAPKPWRKRVPTLGMAASATADDGVAWTRQLLAELQIPGLAAYGLKPADVPALVDKTAQASSMKANPLPLTGDELAAILVAAL